jgi:alkanesulfonate monooxygenase SsuD/methylene tetrahydromethanopterin reductase-like flavin-dependent oxidoreductase (luciferase family)
MTVTFGLALMNDFPEGVSAGERIPMLREQVQEAREGGVSSLWVLQHYLGHMPTLQPLPLLATLAPDAGDLVLGTNMFILPLRHPVDVAEDFATLDHITGGRTIAGFGMGYRENEFASFGIPMDHRVGRFTESVEIIRRLWSGERVTFQGEHFALDDQRISLQPVQGADLPIWIGAGPHKAGARRAGRLGDGWIIPPHVSSEKLADLLPTFIEEGERTGRPAPQRVLRRELVLDHDRERARAIGVAARSSLSAEYGRYNAPQGGAAYRHLTGPADAAEVADASYLFTDPAGAVEAFQELERQGITHVVLRLQWFDLAHEQVISTLRLFRDEVLPALQPG